MAEEKNYKTKKEIRILNTYRNRIGSLRVKKIQEMY